MKTPNKISSILICSIFTFLLIIGSVSAPKAELVLELYDQTVNGEPVPYEITCGGIINFAVTDVYTAFIRASSSDNTRTVELNYFMSPPSSGIQFVTPLPIIGPPGSYAQTEFSYQNPDNYYGFIRFVASDGVDIVYCDLTIDWAQPVELASFVAVVSGNDVALNWTTSSESNNAGFDIERSSVNSGSWSKVGYVAGSGNSSVPMSYTFNDRGLNTGNYSYRLKQTDLNGNFEYHNLNTEVNIGIPLKFELSQNYPNPFNPVTQIDFEIPENGNVNLSIYDNSGKLVSTLTNGFKTAGYYTVNFNATSLASGVYFYRLTSSNFSQVKKMTLIK